MSPYTTMAITRNDAEWELNERGLSVPVSDEGLEHKLFELFEKCLYNFRIVYEYELEDESGYPCQYYRGRFLHHETPEEMCEVRFKCTCCGYPECGHNHRD